MAALFKGFSTIDKDHKHNSLVDIELIKRDLLNHFHTRKGERVMMPEFGSIIWDMMFEPLDATSKELIEEDVRRVVTSDPRLEFMEMVTYVREHGILITVHLKYIPFDLEETLEVSFDRRAVTSTEI